MKTRASRLSAWAVGPFVGVLALASYAWACSAQPGIRSFSPLAGPAQTHVSVEGEVFRPGPVEIRWNSEDGPVLATAQGPAFSTEVTVPQAPKGFYYIVAVQPTPLGAMKAALVYHVTSGPGGAPDSSGADLWSGFSESRTAGSTGPQPSAGPVPSPSALGLGLAALGTAGLLSLLTAGVVLARRRTSSSG